MAVMVFSKLWKIAGAACLLIATAQPVAAAGCDQAAVAAITQAADHSSVRPERMAQLNQQLRERAFDVLALGDSIMEGWPVSQLTAAFNADVLNLGFGTDGVEHVLWRLQGLDWSKQKPKYVLLLAGTNDLHFPPCAVESGLSHLINRIKQQFPEARLIVTSILPRGDRMMDQDAPIRAIDGALAAQAQRDGYLYLDAHDAMTCGHRADCDLFQPRSDNRHPTPKGYAILDRLLAQAIAGAGR
ncbi:MAG: hypothetical protein KGM15_09565 [Pseudomonadota bacterium]|nr:hypothetical protein [Pseudomonadota bacterium]